MNIALTTITLFAILSPGIIFRRFYYTEEFSKEYFKQSYVDLFFASFLPSFLMHFFGFIIIHLFGYEIQIETISILLSGNDNPEFVTKAFLNIHSSGSRIMLYFFVSAIFSALFGYACKLAVRHFKLDRKYKLFRFQNEWHYLFTGEILDFPRVIGKSENISFRFVDVLVNTSEGSILYMGILADYLLSNEGGLDRIILRDVKRRFLKEDNHNNGDVYYNLPGEFLTIESSKIENIHITYYSLQIGEELERQIKDIEID